MRLWSIHPRFLDSVGLVALWREGLLAQKVLRGETKGYKNHPQLDRFKQTECPVMYINNFLQEVYIESLRRGFNFDGDKLRCDDYDKRIKVTSGQLLYEFQHIQNKLKTRNIDQYNKNEKEFSSLKEYNKDQIAYNIKSDFFRQTDDLNIEPWEKV